MGGEGGVWGMKSCICYSTARVGSARATRARGPHARPACTPCRSAVRHPPHHNHLNSLTGSLCSSANLRSSACRTPTWTGRRFSAVPFGAYASRQCKLQPRRPHARSSVEITSLPLPLDEGTRKPSSSVLYVESSIFSFCFSTLS